MTCETAIHPGGKNLKLIFHRCHPILVEFVWELTYEIIDLRLGYQGGRAARIQMSRSVKRRTNFIWKYFIYDS